MEKPSKRGKIPQQDWPSIITRYETGETLASIARTYDCSPPAISYIVSRSRARNAAAEATTSGESMPSETHLVESLPTRIAAVEAGAAAAANSAAGAAAAAGTDSVVGASSHVAADSLVDVPSGRISPAAPMAMARPVGPLRPGEPRLFPDDAVRPPDSRREPTIPARNSPAEAAGHGLRDPYPQRDLGPQRDLNPGGNGSAARSFANAESAPQNGERRTLHLSLSQVGDNPLRPEAHRSEAHRSEAHRPEPSAAA
jgi:hypothetical protein